MIDVMLCETVDKFNIYAFLCTYTSGQNYIMFCFLSATEEYSAICVMVPVDDSTPLVGKLEFKQHVSLQENIMS